uniref:Peptidase n=1 Tax=viral metagenome TaxID=1070528 RepID=A0A6M3MEL8_9ZZZZ
MLIKAGVDISRLNREIRRSLPWAESVYNQYQKRFVVTSTYEGNHGAGSLHYANEAYDLELPVIGGNKIYQGMKNTFPDTFDIVLERDHIHVEHDPKK